MGLCCAALPFQRSREFPESKPAEDPCRNLAPDARCTIHERLRPDGWVGCTEFECFGAGQWVTQHHFSGASWREDPSIASAMFEAFRALQPVHEMLFYLAQSMTIQLPDGLVGEIQHCEAELRMLSMNPMIRIEPSEILRARQTVRPLLDWVSKTVRGRARRAGHAPRTFPSGVRARSELMGTILTGADLRTADLRGALLMGADLDETRMTNTDLLGADLRDASVRGTDLTGALFLTQPQLNSTIGDADTAIPEMLSRPGHWEQ